MEKLSLELPPGYRFSPKDKELIEVFLKPKITGNDKKIFFVPEIEFYEHEPWDLQHKSGIDSKDQEWFFFNALSWKHGSKRNRATREGFWKTTGKDKEIRSREGLIGMKKILVYHRRRTPNGEGTKWVMHEYRTTQEEFDGNHPGQKAFVLCRLFNNEEESNEDGSAKSDVTVPVQSNNYNYHNADVAKNQVAELTSNEDYFNVAELLDMSNVPSPGHTPSSLSPIALDVLTPSIAEDSTLINPLNNLDNGSCGGSDANAQVDQDLDMREATLKTGYIHLPGPYCNSLSPSTLNYHNADVAKNQVAELTSNEDYFNVAELLDMSNVPSPGHTPSSLSPIALDVLTPSIAEDSTLINPLNNLDNGSCGGSDANAQVDQDLDMREAALKTGYIHLPGPYCNSLSPSTLNDYNAGVAKNQAAELTSNEDYFNVVELLDMSNVPSLGDTPSNLSPIAPDILNPNISEDSTLINHLNNLDNGSCGGSDANAQVDRDLDMREAALQTGYIYQPGPCCNSLSPSTLNDYNVDVAKNQAAELTSNEDYFNVAELLDMSNVPSLGDTPSSLYPIAPGVLTPTIFKDSALINPLNNLDNESCGGSEANVQVEQDLDMREAALKTGYIHLPGPYCNSLSPSTLNDYYWDQYLMSWPGPTVFEY
ncbi:hypothetical protein CMV_025460 [Castanea mollissima]|uniref:NAC domain-containing protein n=1 Tax=Castanea mollissima TaxID=60419 RepID=A0A8J4QEF6_9ROSI|nr:hypothetical protein CMV_025460 [Castanea mollissima]